jgi:putative protein-disulfide isomerase
MENEKFTLIYIFDALCGWCYGFSPVIKQIFEKHQQEFDFEVISGGMVLGDSAGPVGKMAELIKSHYPSIEETTGIKYGEPFLEVLDEGTAYFSSEKPSIALAVFKHFHPDKAILFAHDLQFAIYKDGIDLSNDKNYVPLITKYAINEEEFIQKLNSEEFKQAAYYDFALARQLQVTGYPAAFIKTGERNFYMIAKGYTDFETLELRIANVLKESLA